MLALCWLGTTFAGWRAAVARNFALHRVLMRFSYGLAFAGVTLRLQIPSALSSCTSQATGKCPRGSPIPAGFRTWLRSRSIL
jgi:hypothetical protein